MVYFCVLFFMLGVAGLSLGKKDGATWLFGLLCLFLFCASLARGIEAYSRGYPVQVFQRQSDTIYRMVRFIELDNETKLVVAREPNDSLRLFQLVLDDEISSSTTFFKLDETTRSEQFFVPAD